MKYFLSLLFLFFSCALQAADVTATRPVKAGFPLIPGFAEIDQDGTYSGYHYDYLRKLARYTQWRYEFVPCTWETCYTLLKNGEIDLLGGMQRTPEREALFEFAELESFLNYNVLLARADDARFLEKSPDELGVLTVGVIKGSHEKALFEEYAGKHGIHYRFQPYSQPEKMSRALDNGEIDLLLTGSTNKVSKERVLASFAPSPLFFVVRKNDDALLSELNKAQSALKSDDRFIDFRLYEKHYGFSENYLPTLSKAERQALAKAPVLRVAYVSGWRPIAYPPVSGIAADVLNAISDSAGIRLRYVDVASHEAAFEKLAAGEVDVIGFAEADNDLIPESGFRQTIPFLQVPVAQITVTNRNPHVPVRKVAIPRYISDHFLNELKTTRPDIEIIRKNSPHAILDALVANEVDAGYVNLYSANSFLSRPEYASLSVGELANVTTEFSIVFSGKTDRNVVSVFNKYIRQLRHYKLHEFIIANTARQPPLNLFSFIRENPVPAFYGFTFILALTVVFFSTIIGLRNRTHKRITHLLFYDQLTGLPNRIRFNEIVAARLKSDDAGVCGVVYLNINNFKYINDIHDFSKGDTLLRAVARQLHSFIRPDRGEAACRQSGDHFIVFLVAENPDGLKKRMAALNDTLSVFDNVIGPYPVTFSCGVYPVRPGDTVDTAVNYAQYARISRNKASYTTLVYFDDAIIGRIREDRKIEQQMKAALAAGQFVPYFQPKVNMATGRVVGAEALTRWNHPESGLVPPDRFIPLFEKNNFIIQLDLAIFEETCRILHQLREEGKQVFPVSCNFSHNHFTGYPLGETLKEIADRYHIAPTLLDIEITETSVINEVDTVIRATRELRRAGFNISLDDFGVGYSSINLLCQIEVDTIKLDKSFLDQASVLPCKRTLIEGIVDIAENLGIAVLCEGVETPLQAEFLKQAGCTLAQGYLYGKPVPFDTFSRRWLKKADKNIILS